MDEKRELWQVRCPKCGLTFDAIDLRITFIGKRAIGERKLWWCQQCRWLRWMVIEKSSVPQPAGPRCDFRAGPR